MSRWARITVCDTATHPSYMDVLWISERATWRAEALSLLSALQKLRPCALAQTDVCGSRHARLAATLQSCLATFNERLVRNPHSARQVGRAPRRLTRAASGVRHRRDRPQDGAVACPSRPFGQNNLVAVDGGVRHGGASSPNEAYVVGLVNLCLLDDGLTRYLAHSG
jgi:hypothetical protein